VSDQIHRETRRLTIDDSNSESDEYDNRNRRGKCRNQPRGQIIVGYDGVQERERVSYAWSAAQCKTNGRDH
jgi:hypothetical protein